MRPPATVITTAAAHSLVAGSTLREHLLQVSYNDIRHFPRGEMPSSWRFALIDYRPCCLLVHLEFVELLNRTCPTCAPTSSVAL